MRNLQSLEIYESIMNLALGTGQSSFNEEKNIFFIFWQGHRRCGSCEDWKMENNKPSWTRALIETSTWKSKIDTFYLCCKIHQDSRWDPLWKKSHCWHWCKEVVTLMQIQVIAPSQKVCTVYLKETLFSPKYIKPWHITCYCQICPSLQFLYSWPS